MELISYCVNFPDVQSGSIRALKIDRYVLNGNSSNSKFGNLSIGEDFINVNEIKETPVSLVVA